MSVNPLMTAFVKKHLRVSTAALDDEIEGLIQSAISDMKMRGVDTERLIPDGAAISDINPLIARAVVYYAKSNFGIANKVEESDQYWARYDGITQAMSYSSETRMPYEGDDA